MPFFIATLLMTAFSLRLFDKNLIHWGFICYDFCLITFLISAYLKVPDQLIPVICKPCLLGEPPVCRAKRRVHRRQRVESRQPGRPQRRPPRPPAGDRELHRPDGRNLSSAPGTSHLRHQQL